MNRGRRTEIWRRGGGEELTEGKVYILVGWKDVYLGVAIKNKTGSFRTIFPVKLLEIGIFPDLVGTPTGPLDDFGRRFLLMRRVMGKT